MFIRIGGLVHSTRPLWGETKYDSNVKVPEGTAGLIVAYHAWECQLLVNDEIVRVVGSPYDGRFEEIRDET